MIREAIEFLMNVGKTEVLDLLGQKYSTKRLEHVKEPQPASLKLSTLTGIVDYVKSQIDKIDGKLLIQVVDHERVLVFSPLKADKNRDLFLDCSAVTPGIHFNNFIDAERFNIMLQSCFLPNEDRAVILRLVGNVEEVKGINAIDDGVTQRVTARTGIKLADEVPVPNPVTLIPFMTFVEIEQPEIKYVFRMQDGPKAALFEADGGAWKLQAMKNIKKYLSEQLSGASVEIIA